MFGNRSEIKPLSGLNLSPFSYDVAKNTTVQKCVVIRLYFLSNERFCEPAPLRSG